MTTATNKTIANLKLEEEQRVSESLFKQAMRRLRRDKLTLGALGIFFFITILSFSAPALEGVFGVNYTRTNVNNAFQPPCMPALGVGTEACDARHILGTDDLGRDHFTRLLYAGQISLGIAISAAIISIVIGVSLGMITGYYGGVVDDIIVWIITTLNSIPSLFLLLILSAVIITNPNFSGSFLSGPLALVGILGFLGWTGTTRLVRGETLSLREREYITSARALGASSFRIMFVHILPNLISVVVITLALDIGGLILVEAALSFLGLGVKAPAPSWGNMLTNAQTFFTKGIYLVIMPGLFIFLTVLCLYVIGDGIRDAFDPTQKD